MIKSFTWSVSSLLDVKMRCNTMTLVYQKHVYSVYKLQRLCVWCSVRMPQLKSQTPQCFKSKSKLY